MFFPYQCKKCSHRFDGSFTIGKAPRETPCPKCKGVGKRIYEGMSIAVKIDGRTTSGIARKSTFGEEMRARNESAGKRMKGLKAPVRLVAMDYGGGKVEEVKAK